MRSSSEGKLELLPLLWGLSLQPGAFSAGQYPARRHPVHDDALRDILNANLPRHVSHSSLGSAVRYVARAMHHAVLGGDVDNATPDPIWSSRLHVRKVATAS